MNLKDKLVFLKLVWSLVLKGANPQFSLDLNGFSVDLNEYSDIKAGIVYSSKPDSGKDVNELLDKGKDTYMDDDSGSDVDMNEPLDKGKGKETEDTVMKDDSGSDISSDEGLDEDIVELLQNLKNSVQTDNVKRQIKSLEKLLTGEIEEKVPVPPKPPVPDFWGHGWYTPKPPKPPVPDHWGHGWYGPPKDQKPVENTNEGSDLVPIREDIGTSSSVNIAKEKPTQKPLNTGNTEEVSEIRGDQDNAAGISQGPENESNIEETSKEPENKGNTNEVSDSKTNENTYDVSNNKGGNTDKVSGNNTRNTYEVSDNDQQTTDEICIGVDENPKDIVHNIFEPYSIEPIVTPMEPSIDFIGGKIGTELPPYVWDYCDLFSLIIIYIGY